MGIGSVLNETGPFTWFSLLGCLEVIGLANETGY